MNRSDMDWSYVRRYTLRPSLCALLAAIAVAAATWLHNDRQQLYWELSANHEAVHKDYDALVKQRKLIDRYHRYYQRLHELGFIGRESRLDWVETLRRTSASLSMPRLSYAIDPQLGVVAPVRSTQGGEKLQIRVSRLQLDMGLFHEIDLLRFFDALQRRAPGLIKVDECSLRYRGDVPGAATENLTASCVVQIFSIITSDVIGEAT